jgi:hypothetical protein
MDVRQFVSEVIAAHDDPIIRKLADQMPSGRVILLGVSPGRDPRYSPFPEAAKRGWSLPLKGRHLILPLENEAPFQSQSRIFEGRSYAVAGPISEDSDVQRLFYENTRWINPVALVSASERVDEVVGVVIKAYDDEGFIAVMFEVPAH